jgi:hypothetical protein
LVQAAEKGGMLSEYKEIKRMLSEYKEICRPAESSLPPTMVVHND